MSLACTAKFVLIRVICGSFSEKQVGWLDRVDRNDDDNIQRCPNKRENPMRRLSFKGSARDLVTHGSLLCLPQYTLVQAAAALRAC